MNQDTTYIVKKDYLPFIKGDIVTISQYTSNNSISFSVDREIDVVFHGNEKGRWSVENRPKKGDKMYFFKKELQPRKTVLELTIPQVPKDTVNYYENCIPNSLYNGMEWSKICMNQAIQNYIDLGVF
jgi:hypothetical protein